MVPSIGNVRSFLTYDLDREVIPPSNWRSDDGTMQDWSFHCHCWKVRNVYDAARAGVVGDVDVRAGVMTDTVLSDRTDAADSKAVMCFYEKMSLKPSSWTGDSAVRVQGAVD